MQVSHANMYTYTVNAFKTIAIFKSIVPPDIINYDREYAKYWNFFIFYYYIQKYKYIL